MPPRQCPQRNRCKESVNHDGRGEDSLPLPPPPPPIVPRVPELVAQTNQLIAIVLAHLPQPQAQRETVGCTSANFFRHHSPTFDGVAGAIATNRWLTGKQILMRTVKYPNEQKVEYASLKLMGEAAYWWMSKHGMLVAELGENVLITWERFQKEFNDLFIPKEQREMRVREFLTLTQGNMTVEQYVGSTTISKQI
jgi:hypothetical protein